MTFFQIKLASAMLVQNFPIDINALESLPISATFSSGHLDLNLFAVFSPGSKFNDVLYNKFRLLIKLFVDYRLDIHKLVSMTTMHDLQYRTLVDNKKIMDFSTNNYMRKPMDSPQLELLEHLESIAHNDLKNAIPNIINWSDANIGKNSSGYCAVRNAYHHPNLYEDTKKKLSNLFNLPSEFNQDGSINRYSSNNQKNLELSIEPILQEIRDFFLKKYFKNEIFTFSDLVHPNPK